MKKCMIWLLALCLLFALPTMALADSTPERYLAVVTPAEDDEIDDIVNKADNTKADKTSDESDEQTDDQLITPVDDDNVADDTDDTDDNGNADNTDNNVEPAEPTPAPKLPQSLNVQFYDKVGSRLLWQTVTPVNLLINGSYLPSDVPGMATSGRTLVPVRVISESLSATVDWQKEDNTVTIRLKETTIVLTIGESTALVNGEQQTVPDNVSVSLVNYDGVTRTMVPVRFVSENLSATVNYDSASRSVDIIPPTPVEEELPPPGIADDGTLYRRVVLDAGHGGDDPGTNGGEYEEKVITLSVAQKVQALLEEAEYEVIMSRTDDTYVALTDRAALTREYNAPIFVSIHCNAAENIPTANGIETYAAPKDEADAELAACLQTRLVAETEAKDRGVKTSQLVVLTHNDAPAALVEIGFMTNADECAKITDESYQDIIAAAIAAGISDYFDGK